jgi:hypothetical protein
LALAKRSSVGQAPALRVAMFPDADAHEVESIREFRHDVMGGGGISSQNPANAQAIGLAT